MTDDPVKLYVVVMAILLCVLGYVAYTSYQEANEYEAAYLRAPNEAKTLREAAAEVQALCLQLSKAKLREGYLTLVEEAGRDVGVQYAALRPPTKPIRIESNVFERRWTFEFRPGGRSRALKRAEVAKLCQAVERYSQNILKTIEINLTRMTGGNLPAVGKEDEVTTDVYRGKVIFGLRTVDRN